MESKTLFLLLDAFRGDYINPVDTPFLFSRINSSVFSPKLKSTSGFTQRSAIFTGTSGIKTGMFTMFFFDSENSPFRFLRNHSKLKYFAIQQHWWDNLPNLKGIRAIKHVIERSFNKEKKKFKNWIVNETKRFANNANPAHIPFHLLPEIAISEDKRPIYLPGAHEEIESIFDVLSQEEVNYDYVMYPVVNVEDDYVVDVLKRKRDSDTLLYLGQFSDSDFLIHHCGPSSNQRRKIVGEIDRKLRELVTHYGENINFIIIGDHGMTDVVEEIDIISLIKSLEEKHKAQSGVDYIPFLDSTMARFFWKTITGKNFLSDIKELPELLHKGRFIDKDLAQEYDLPLSDRRYGDLIWWANSGILIFPDYFHDLCTHNKGMHGYDTNSDDMKGFFIAFGPGIKPVIYEQVELIDVCPSICSATGIPTPLQNEGKNLLEWI